MTKMWSKIYVIIQGIIMKYLNVQSFPSPFSIPKLHLKYTKEILKSTMENIGQRDFSFFPFTIFIYVIWVSGYIHEVLTVLLTPITPYRMS